MRISDERNPVVLQNCFIAELGVWVPGKLPRRNDAVSEKIIGLAYREDLEHGGRVAGVKAPEYATAAQKRLPGIVETREADRTIGARM